MKKKIYDVIERQMWCDNCKSVEVSSLIIKRATEDSVIFLRCCHNCNTEEYKEPENSDNWEIEKLLITDWNALITHEIFT